MLEGIVVTGATGKQGGSLLRALLTQSNTTDVAADAIIYAVTRDPDSSAARSIASLSSRVKIVRGDFSNTSALFSALPRSNLGLYIVTTPGKNEVAWAKALIDTATERNIQHIVFSSVDRGRANGGNTPSTVPHWQSKHEIESYLRRRAKESNGKLTYTILRPVFFLDNLTPDFAGKVSASIWKDYLQNKKLKVIDSKDIGTVAASAFMNPVSPFWRNAEINLAGDELTFTAANRIFMAKTGKPMSTTPKFLTALILFAANDLKLMTSFLQTEGFGAAVQREIDQIKLAGFEDWLVTNSHDK
jgi:uncharacterized protein YbjT (DUF2867 family)